ncbi:MAG: ArnT family glycosyltransferase [Verrucomicrobiales bacterium]
MASPHPSQQDLTPATMIRWALFLLLVVCVTFFYLVIDFKGLAHGKGMDQAQIAREIARGNNFITKCIRPVALWQINEHLKEEDPKSKGVDLVGLQDTYHSPLNPLLNSILLRIVKKRGEPAADGLAYDGESKVFFLDYLIAAGSMLLLLAAIGVSYLLICRIFDPKIAGVTALLMLLCGLLWWFAQSGLPQPLMLFLFSFAMYFLYKAVENVQVGRGAYLWIVLSGLFFGLLALAHWIAIWVFIGALIYVAFFLRPRGVLALIMFGVFFFIVIWWPLLVNYPVSGNPMGSGLYQFYSGLAGGSEGMVMRNLNPTQEPLNPDGFIRKIAYGTVSQLTSIFSFLGGIVAAPLFFLSLLHPFKRPEIAQFRWAIVLMWLWAAIGMAIFGIPEGDNDPNQLNILFIPVMTAYGLALLSVLWSRLAWPGEYALVRNGHFVIVLLVSAAPMLLTVPWDIATGLRSDFKANWPPYLPRAYPALREAVAENEIIATDAPWAVAWYSDRTALWLPRTRKQFFDLVEGTKAKGYPVAGVLVTPLSSHMPYAKDILGKRGEYGEWAPLIENFSIASWSANKVSSLSAMEEGFPFRVINPITGTADMVFYSDRRRLK